MNFRQLHYFTVLAQELSFTRAAQRLHISQPPLSRQIAELEADLGVSLFNRSSRRVELTEAGKSYLSDVQDMFERMHNATLRAQAIEHGVEGRLQVGLSDSHFMGPLPKLMAKYSKQYPNVVIALSEMVPAKQVHALIERRIDLNISRVPIDDTLLRSVPLWRDPVVVALPRGHPLSKHETVSIKHLKGEKLVVLRPDSSVFAETIYQKLTAMGCLPDITQIVAQVPAQVYLVEAGLGVAIVPLSVCTRFNEVDWCYLYEPDLSTDVYAVVRHDANKPTIDTFVDALKTPSALEGA